MEPKTIEFLQGIISSGVEVCLISKYWDDETLMKFYKLGYRKFGENRVEALEKRSQKLPNDIEWHFVGNIQSRDLKKICHYASTIQSFDRPDLLEKLSKFDEDIEILIQVNLLDDNSRNGVSSKELDLVMKKINDLQINCNGFMFHPPIELSNIEKTKLFNQMNEIFSKYPDYSILSMGTSNDYQLANQCGATLNRLGRVLFE